MAYTASGKKIPDVNIPGKPGYDRRWNGSQWTYVPNGKPTTPVATRPAAPKPVAAKPAAPVVRTAVKPAPGNSAGPTGSPQPDMPQLTNDQWNQLIGSLPYDPSLDQYDFSLEQDRQKFLQDLMDQQTQTQRNVGLAQRNIQDQMPTTFRNLLNNFAARGMARSSGYADQYGNAQKQYAQQLTDLQNQGNQVNADAEKAKAAYDQLYWQRKSQLAQQRAAKAGG